MGFVSQFLKLIIQNAEKETKFFLQFILWEECGLEEKALV